MFASTISFQTRLTSFNRYWLSFTAFNIFKNLSETRPKYAGRACGGTPCGKGSVGMEIRQKSSVWWGGFRTVCWTLVTIESLLISIGSLGNSTRKYGRATWDFSPLCKSYCWKLANFLKLVQGTSRKGNLCSQASTNWLQLWLQISHGQVELREIFFLGVSMMIS